MNYSKLKLLLFLFILFDIGCDSNKANTSGEIASIDTSFNSLGSNSFSNPIDTISLVKDHCFILENIIPSGEDQYRRLIKFDNTDKCSYNVISAHSTKMGNPATLDGRNNGQWKIKNDIIYIKWDAYYTRLSRDNENWGEELKFNRIIEGKYKILITNNILSFQFISEKVISSDLDETNPESAITLFYNNDIEGLIYKNVNCVNVESIYMVKNFTPLQKQKANKFLDDYNKQHSCNNQRSFDAGYDLARDQIGNGLLADADYLYRLTSNEYDYYCFKKGVEQYIRDQKEY